MALMSITVNDPTMPSKHAEVAYIIQALEIIKTELGRGNGTVTSGSIIGDSNAGVPNTSLGSWTYTPSASTP